METLRTYFEAVICFVVMIVGMFIYRVFCHDMIIDAELMEKLGYVGFTFWSIVVSVGYWVYQFMPKYEKRELIDAHQMEI